MRSFYLLAILPPDGSYQFGPDENLSGNIRRIVWLRYRQNFA